MERPRFNQAAFQAAVERMKAGTDAGNDNPTPQLDPKLRADVVADATKGRSADEFKLALQHHGFVYSPPGAFVNGSVQKDGVWRRRWRAYNLRIGVTAEDLLTMWRGAEDFDEWVKNAVLKAKLKTTGQRLPPLLTVRR